MVLLTRRPPCAGGDRGRLEGDSPSCSLIDRGCSIVCREIAPGRTERGAFAKSTGAQGSPPVETLDRAGGAALCDGDVFFGAANGFAPHPAASERSLERISGVCVSSTEGV